MEPTAPVPQRPPRLRGPRIYYLLAAFDVLTVSASLYLNHRIMGIYVHSVEADQEWAARMSDYSALGQIAAEVNAPGNDVFDSGDVPRESARMQRALGAFEARLAALRNALPETIPRAEAVGLLERMAEIERAMEGMVTETHLIFSFFADGRRAQAGQRMATMDRSYARLLGALRELSAGVAAIQQRHFARQTAAAAALQKFEIAIAALILVMVGAATVYGRKVSAQALRAAQERATHIERLQQVGESLRSAHADLEKRVQERTRALRNSEAALRRAAQEWLRTFEAIESPVLVLDSEGRVMRLNRAACELAASPGGEPVGQLVETLGEGEPWRCAPDLARRVCRERTHISLRARDAGCGKIWEVAGNLVPGEEGGGSERIVVVARDVTALVELQDSVRREERMSAMGSLVAGVAHEVRNPLFGISSTLDALEARHAPKEPLQRYLKVLRQEVDRLGALMRDLLDYGKPPGLDVAAAGFEGVVDEAVRICEPLANTAGVPILKARGWRIGPVMMDRSRVLQVFQNVIQNAIQHSPEGSPVFVSGGVVREDGRAWAWCSIRDCGNGLRAEDLRRVFEPFFTRRSGGTGLGLSIAHRIVTQHGGTLEAANHPETGAVVTVRLPVGGAPTPSAT